MLNDYLKTIPQYLMPKHGITALAGHFANVKKPAVKNYLIRHFIQQYGVNMKEALIEDPTSYNTFNEFFIRHLKPECRPLANADIVSPVDGSISEVGNVDAGKLLQAKKRYYSIDELLGADGNFNQSFYNGRFATLYLSPKDYHRVHMPISSTLKEMLYIPGKLFSVQPATARVVPKLFARNKRLVIYFDTPAGLMAMVMVGATVVGAIGTSWHGDVKNTKRSVFFEYPLADTQVKTFNQGDEMGYFKLGSTVILLFADQAKMQWRSHLKAGQTIRFGEGIGDVIYTQDA